MAGRLDSCTTAEKGVESSSNCARQTPPPTRPKRRADPPVVRQIQAVKPSEEKSVVMGFHPLRSLRNIFFGYKRKEKQTMDVSCTKAKSTDDLEPKPTGSAALKQSRRQSCPFNKQFSLSADNLLDPSEIEWKPAPPDVTCFSASSTPAASTSLAPIKLKSKTSLCDESVIHSNTSNLLSLNEGPSVIVSPTEDDAATEEFFKDNWSKGRPRITSTEVMYESTQDLDAIGISTQHLNLMAAKDKIAVRQKGKRMSTALTHKTASHLGSQTLIEEVEIEQEPSTKSMEEKTMIRQSSHISETVRHWSVSSKPTYEQGDNDKTVVDSKKVRLSLVVQAKSDAAESKAKLPKCRRSSDVSATVPTSEASCVQEDSSIPESPDSNQRIYARLKKLEFTPVKSPRTKKKSGSEGPAKKTH